jgi:hypothetical protein
VGRLIYERNTTYPITHFYQFNGQPATTGLKLFFTVKASKFDTDPTDNTALIKKTIVMTGSQTLFHINPTDVVDSVAEGKYYYDLKILDSISGMILGDSGTFKITAHPTNRDS